MLLGGCGLKTLQKPSGDVEDVVGVREESFQVKIRQLKGTKMPQGKTNTSERRTVCSGGTHTLLSTRLLPAAPRDTRGAGAMLCFRRHWRY